MNNVHLSSVLEVSCTDYGLMNALNPNDALTIHEGIRLDIFCLGVMILKMMGKLRLYKGNDIDFYLENI